MELEDKILKLIKSRKKGILQNELWKKAEIDRRKCSRILEKLEKEGKIVREEETDKSVRTYRIKSVEIKEKKAKDFKLLMVRELFDPCTGCSIECVPEHCIMLKDWVFGLIDIEL
ncbi:MAG: Lrp/AsnC family transcriptional regulator [Candidatus Methanoperedens sp.]|nr:Lrp/AsnC family transcriptional regulator [Candidatus Methanoperedens sp.]MCE8426072.1 Lrp/AsnC family transcriptional regulator [Candidatus Methanoperedens sp.]MCE8428828.1 Lrp/AsnC family transcriptional regulator [Candidatus Methanoperedens sp.]